MSAFRLEDVIYSTLTSRVIINIRNVSQGETVGKTTELHDIAAEPWAVRQTLSLEFGTFHEMSSRRINVDVGDC